MPKVTSYDEWLAYDLARIQAEKDADELETALRRDDWRDQWISQRASYIVVNDAHEALKAEVRSVRAFFSGGQ